jgi:hypothetical protein
LLGTPLFGKRITITTTIRIDDIAKTVFIKIMIAHS